MQPPAESLCLKPGYRSRRGAKYFRDTVSAATGVTYQPDVYTLAAHLAGAYGCTHLVDLGCGRAEKLLALADRFRLIGLDFGPNLDHCRRYFPQGIWIDWDLERTTFPHLEPTLLAASGVICADVVEHLADPFPLLRHLKGLLDHVPFAVLSTPERDCHHSPDHFGPPPNPCHVREWNRTEFTDLLQAARLRTAFCGLTASDDRSRRKATTVAVLEHNTCPAPTAAPPEFRVLAVVSAFNEEDVIGPTVDRLLRQGVAVYLLDNWSTDHTEEIARRFLGRGLLAIERFPPEGPSPTYDWARLLGRVERLCQKQAADWYIHHDADEEHESPWPGVGLRDALWRVDRRGFNCVDYTVLAFHPTDNDYPPGTPLGVHFRSFEFDSQPASIVCRRAWKRTPVPVDLTSSGGHDVRFLGRRVYPYRFLLKHYPVRSQAHGERKVFRERRARWNAAERAKGWHDHYDTVQPGHCFLRRPEELLVFDPATFYVDFLVERLTGRGVCINRRLK